MRVESPSSDDIRARFRLPYSGFTLDVDLVLPGRGVTALFGHSGSGKTTLLRCIAGLERVPDGWLSVNGTRWQDGALFVAPHRRALGYVFQEASLFTHLSVRQNLEFGLKRLPPSQRRQGLDAPIQMLGIGALLDRPTQGLSGGERQRVAIARALAVSPQLLLMDEPLASLDLARKQEILPYLQRLHDELDIPVIYVSHAPDEVARLADHIVLLAQGQVVAQGGLHETLSRLDLAGAFDDDISVVVEATVAGHDDADHLSRLDFLGGSLQVSRRAEAIGQHVRFRVRASDVSLAADRPSVTSILNVMQARVVEQVPATTAGQVLVKLDLGGTPLIARVTGRSCRLLDVAPGRWLWVQIKSVALLR